MKEVNKGEIARELTHINDRTNFIKWFQIQ